MANAVLTNKHLGWFAGPDSALTDQQWVDGPTLAAVQGLVNHSAGIRVDGTDFNIEASEQVDDRSFADEAGAQSRGPAQASGSLEVFVPGKNDRTSPIAKAYDALTIPRTPLGLLQRPVLPESLPLAAGQEVNLFRVITDERQHNRNEASRSTSVGLVLQDDILVNYIIPSDPAAAVAVTPAGPLTIGIGKTQFLKATYHGHNVTAGASWESSNEAIVKVTKGGVAVGIAAGTAQLRVTVPGSAVATPISVTVSAPAP